MYKLEEIAKYFNRPIREIVASLALYGYEVAPYSNEFISEKMRNALIKRYGNGPFHISGTGVSGMKPISKVRNFRSHSSSNGPSSASKENKKAVDSGSAREENSFQSSIRQIESNSSSQEYKVINKVIPSKSLKSDPEDSSRVEQAITPSNHEDVIGSTTGIKTNEGPRYIDYIVCPSCKVGGYMYCPKCLGAGGWYEWKYGFLPVPKIETIGAIQKIHKRFNLALKQPLWNSQLEDQIMKDVEFLSTKIHEEGVKELLEGIESARMNRHRYKLAIKTKTLAGDRVDQVISLVNGSMKDIGNQRLFMREARDIIAYRSKMTGENLRIPMDSLSMAAELLVRYSSAIAIDSRITFQFPDIGEAVDRGDLADYYIIKLIVNGRQKTLFITDYSIKQSIREATLKK